MKVWLRKPAETRMGGPLRFTETFADWLHARDVAVTYDCRQTAIDVALAIPNIESADLRVFKWRRIPIVQRMDGVPYNTPGADFAFQTARLRRCYEVCDAVVFQSRFSKEVVERSFGPARVHSCVVYNGADLDAFEPGPLPSHRPLTVACASVWRPQKRLTATLRGFLAYHERKPDSRLLVIGPTDRVADERIEHAAVSYLGALDRHAVVDALRSAHLFLHLAWLDWCPNVVIEAQAVGLPVICADGGGTREIVVEGAGLVIDGDPPETPSTKTNIYDPAVIPEISPDRVADAIEHVSGGLAKRQRILSEARSDLGIERAGSEYLTLFEDLVRGRIKRSRRSGFLSLALQAMWRRLFGK